MTTNTQENWREEFEENRPKTDDAILINKKESDHYYFGYKHQENGSIYEVTDWGNIKEFISQVESSAIQRTREEVVEKLEGMKQSLTSIYDSRFTEEEVLEVRSVERGYNKALSDALSAIKQEK